MKECIDCRDNGTYGWAYEKNREGDPVPSCKECGYLDESVLVERDKTGKVI